MSKLTSTTLKKLLATSVIVTLGGVAAAVSAAPTLFDATATVQTAVTITEVTPLTFGTVFVTKSAATNALASTNTGAAPLSNKLILSPAGTVSKGTDVAGAPMLSLGSAVAGSYNIPGLPATSKIGLDITNATAEGTFANAAHSTGGTNSSCGYNTPTAALSAGKIVLSIAGGDPATTGFFCLDALTATSGATDITTTLLPTATFASPPVPTAATGFTLPFGATSLAFNLGGTLVQQAPHDAASVQRTYQAGTYSGKIGMEVVFK